MHLEQAERLGLALIAAWLAVIGVACAHYVPTLPLRSRAADAELQLDHLRTSPRTLFVLRSHTTAPHRIRHAWLTVPTREPCTGGAEVAEIAIDENPTNEGALPPGDHVLAVRFDDALKDFTLDVVIDFETDTDGCWRVPAVSQTLAFEPESRWMVGGALDLDGTTGLRGLDAVFDVRASAGHWVGPVQLDAALGVGESLCQPSACGRNSDNSLRGGPALSLALDARWAFASGRLNRLYTAGLVGARYAVHSVGLPVTGGDQRFVVHALQGVLTWAYDVGGPRLLRHGERGLAYELSIPLGVLMGPDGIGHPAFAGGFEVRFVFQP